MCHVAFLMSHVILHSLWQGRDMSFCWDELQSDAETKHKIKYLLKKKKITWSIGLKYQAATKKGTERSQCKSANCPHPVYFSIWGLHEDCKDAPDFLFRTPLSNIFLCFQAINHFHVLKCQTARYTEKNQARSQKIWVRNPDRPLTGSDFSQAS